jgi:hypothetical protein
MLSLLKQVPEFFGVFDTLAKRGHLEPLQLYDGMKLIVFKALLTWQKR